MCVVRWSDRENDLIHIRHWNGFWPANIYRHELGSVYNRLMAGRDASCSHTCVVITTLRTRVYSDVASELIAPRKPSVTLRHGARVRPLVHRGLAGPVGILPGPHWHQSDREAALLVHLDIIPVKITVTTINQRQQKGKRHLFLESFLRSLHAAQAQVRSSILH